MSRRSVPALLLALILAGVLPMIAALGPRTVVRAQATPTAAALVVAGDRIAALVASPPGSSVVYAAGERGFYQSADGGETWDRVGEPPPPGDIVAGTDDGRLLLAGARPPCGSGEAGLPLHRSRDGGATWEPLPELTGVQPLAIWHDPALAIVAGCARVLLSTDEGETWRESADFDANYIVTALVPVADDPDAERAALVAGTSGRGTTNLWRLDLTEGAAPRVGDRLTQFWGTGALAARERRYVAGTATGVLISSDGGATWALQRDGLEAVTVSVDPFLEEIPAAEQARGFGIFAVAIDPADADRLYVGTIDGLYRSVDGAASWQRLPGVDGRVSAIGIGPTPGRLLAQTDAGVFTVPANA